MTDRQKETEKFLKNLAGAVDDILEESFGERIPFSIMIWGKNKADRANYISNVDRTECIEALRATLIRWENNNVDRVDGSVNPNTN